MNLNEKCLLKFLQNPDSLNDLTYLLGEYMRNNQQDFSKKDFNFLGTVNE